MFFRARPMPTSRPHVHSPHGKRASYEAIPESIRARSRSQSSWTCSDLAVHVVTAAAVQDGPDGLSSLRMICKAASCDKRLCMIDHVAIGHVSGSHQLGRVLYEVVAFSILGHRLRESSAW